MSTTTVPPSLDDPCALLTAVAVRLAAPGDSTLREVLRDVVAALELRSAVLRSSDTGALLAVAGDVVHAVPDHRDPARSEPVVELPVGAHHAQLATLTVVGARPTQLPLLRALCAVLALALAPVPTAPDAALSLALLDAADADADAAADDLHDGPVQEVLLARFAADAAVRTGDAGAARDAVQGALQSLRRTLWLLRPRGAGDGGLVAALEQLSERLVESGRRGLALDVDPQACAELGRQAASLSYRVVQWAARDAEAPSAVTLGRGPGLVRLTVEAAPLPTGADRWTARARALGAVLEISPTGRIALTVPTDPRTDLPTDIEAIS